MAVHCARFPPHIRDDAAQAARVGLWRAASTWEPGKSNFYGWARSRIRWEIADEMRRLDHLGRNDRDYLNRYREWERDKANTDHHTPSHRSAQEAGWDTARLAYLTTGKTTTERVEDPPAPDDTCAQAVSNLMSDRLQDALAGLPYAEWQTATLRWLEDWPPTKIAEFTGVKEPTVYFRLRRARERLRRHLKGEEYV